MKTKVIHIKDSGKGEDEEYIGRAGKNRSGYFGNPYRVGEKCIRCGEVHTTPGSTLGCYREYLVERLGRDDPLFHEGVKQLYGKTLVCFCKPNSCHGDYLAFATEVMHAIHKLGDRRSSAASDTFGTRTE